MDPLVLLPQHVRSIVTGNDASLSLPKALKDDYALVAIIDISGYSKLSSKLEEALGTDSGAKIKDVINPPMDVITQYVHKYAGSIVKLAGDAVIACWTLDPDSANPVPLYQKALCLNVLLCCLELLELFRDYKITVNLPSKFSTITSSPHTDIFEQSLKIHIGLALGSLDHIHIGGRWSSSKRPTAQQRRYSSSHQIASYGRREYFIAGEALAKAGTNLNLGKQGDFVFTSNFNQCLMETIGISGSPMEESSYSISEKDATSEFQLKAFKYLMPLKNCQIESKESLLVPFNERNVNYLPYAKSYIDDSVAKVIGMVQGRVTDQLRSVSVVFLKFGGFQSETVAEARNLKQLQDASLLIMRKVHEFEGCIRQFNCDDKSLTALLVWGLEGQAHEKGESYVAMLAATEIAKQIPNCLEDKLGFSIGVTTGTVFAGIVGSKERCDNTVLGVVVNNAARLMCLDQCLGTVLCDHETYLKTVSHFQYVTDIPPVTLKGVPHPVKIYNPMGDNVSVRSHAHISVCGREKELETMSNSLHMWRSSQHAKSIILLGSSGIGKTQITSWLQDQIEETEVLCVGLALEHKKETLLFCWMRVFHSFLDQVCGNVDAMSKLETKHGGDIGKRKDDNSTEGSTDNNESESPTTNKFLAEPVVQRRPGSGRSDVRSDIWYNPYRSGLNVNFAMMSKDVTPKKPSVYEDIQVTQQETTILNEEGKPSTSVSLPLSVRTHNSPTSANFSTTTPVSMSPPGASSDQNVAKNSDENDDNVETSLTKHKFTSEIAVRPPRPWSGRSERGNIATMRQDRIHESAANSDSLSKVVNFKNSSNLAKYSNSPPTLSLESVHASPGHSRDNLHSEKEKSSAAFLRTLQPWSGKSSSRNSYTLRQSPNMIQRGLTAIECGESGHSLNPGLQSKARSDEDLRNSNKGILKGQSDSPRPRSRHSGLGVRLFTSEGRTPSRLLERMSISNVSETTSSNKDKLPKLLRILTTLNIPLSCIETLNPITGFSTSQSFVNGISSVAEVLSEILNAVCDVGVRICVTLDDIQWCDSYSLELAKNLIHKCPKVLFVFTARPLQEWRPTSGELLKKILQEDIHTIEVKPMDSRGVEQMCKSRLSPLMDFHSISEEMVREILNRGQGNPMVTGILISTLIEERMISVKDGVIVAMGLKDLQLAFGSAAAVIAQFDKLSAQMKCLLRVFAISGQYFKLDEVSAALFLFHSSVEETGVQPAPSAILALLRAEDKYNFIKHTDDENEMCFSHYLIQQAIISSMVPSMRENIRKVFIQFYESALLHSEGAARASYRQSLIFFLRKISGEEQKKKVHIYEAFLECGEMNQSMEALEYYEMLSELTKDMDVADTFLKKVREYRVLARIYFERGEYEKALTLGRNSLAVLGCKPSLVNPSLLTLVGNVYSLVKKTISILNLRSDQAIKAAASVLLIETFPNAELFSATSQKSCKYMRPMTEEEQDKLFQEIISIVIIMNHVYEQTKPGLEMLMLSLLITAPSLLAQESRTYRICFYFSTLATITKIFGFLQLSAVAKQNASGMFEMLSSNDMEHHMTLYESFMYANTFEVLAVESVLESDIFTAAFNYRKAFTLTIRQGLGMSDKSFLFAEFARLHMQTSGYDDEIVENWFDRNERRHYGKGAKPFFLAEGAISVANSLARLNDLDRALSLYEEGMKHFVACHETFNDVLRLLQFHVNVIRIKVCASRMKRDSSDIAENMKAIEMCMKNAPLRVFAFSSWLQFLLIMSEHSLDLLNRKESPSRTSREISLRIFRFIKTQITRPKLHSWPYVQAVAQSLIPLWQNGGCAQFVMKAQRAIDFVQREKANIPAIQILMLGSRIWQARGIGLDSRNAVSLSRWKIEGETIKEELIRTGLRLDWELYLINSAMERK